jgi:tetratricopeptide (TPR) repeat protein
MAIQRFFNISKQTRILLIILVCISAIGFFIAWLYYDNKNQSEDPRVIGARIMLVEYDRLMKERRYTEALRKLDTIDRIYENTTGYRGSFEAGLLANNRGSVYLSMALYDSLVPADEKEVLLRLAADNVQKSIVIYQSWIDSVGPMSKDQIKACIKAFFKNSDPELKGKNINHLVEKRVEDIVHAQIETPRRLSVSYTNLGIIQRHQFRQEEAAKSYIEAIKLWKDNFTARNNFNVLMGLPPEDRSIIEKLFPPERLKSE